MSLLEKVPTLPFAGALDGTEALSVIGSAGLPVQTTTQDIAALSGAGPTNATYLVQTANAGLSAERVVTDTTTIEWDFGTAGQAKANASAALIDTLWTVSITAGSESANAFPLTVQVKDFAGTNLSGARSLYVVALSNNTITYTDNGAGSIVKQGFTPQRAVVFQTDSTGLAEFTVGNSATEDVAVVFVTPQGPIVQLLSFA